MSLPSVGTSVADNLLKINSLPLLLFLFFCITFNLFITKISYLIYNNIYKVQRQHYK